MGIVVDGALGQSGSPGAECGKLGPDLSTREIDSGASHCYLLDLEKTTLSAFEWSREVST